MNTLNDQLCFSIYVASKEIIKKYQDLLEKIDLTYTQYIVMLVMWEEKKIDMKVLGKKLYLSSNTLTPVINRLIEKGYVSKERGVEDKRNLTISLLDKGQKIQKKAMSFPKDVFYMTNLTLQEKDTLYHLSKKITKHLSKVEG